MRKVKCFFELDYGDRFFADKIPYLKLDQRYWIGPEGGLKEPYNALNAIDGSLADFEEGLAVEIEFPVH